MGHVKVKRNIHSSIKLVSRSFTDYKLKENDYEVTEYDVPFSVADKRVLLIDDGILSGGTVRTAKSFLKGKGASLIDTYIIHGKKPKDYTLCAKDTFIFYGPWGLV